MKNVSYMNVEQMVVCDIKGLVLRYTFLNEKGNVIIIKKSSDSCITILKSTKYTLTDTFTLSEFDNDFVQFNACVKDIIRDTFEDGYHLIDTHREVKYSD